MKKAKINRWNIYKYVLLFAIGLLGAFLLSQIIFFMDAEKDSGTYEIWTTNTMSFIKGIDKVKYGSIPVKDHEIVQTFEAAGDRMQRFLIRFTDFSPATDTATLTVTLQDTRGHELYKYKCPVKYFAEMEYFYVEGEPYRDLESGELYEIHVSLDNSGSDIAVCTAQKKGTHDSAKKLTVDGMEDKEDVFFLVQTYYSDFDYVKPWFFLILGTLVLGVIIGFIPSEVPTKIWQYLSVFVLMGAAFYLFQALDRDGLYTVESTYIPLNLMLILSGILVIKGLLPYVSSYASIVLVLIWSLTNYYVIQFKGEDFLLTQLSAFRTTMSVAGNYQYEITPKVLTAVAVSVCLIALQIIADIRTMELGYRRRNPSIRELRKRAEKFQVKLNRKSKKNDTISAPADDAVSDNTEKEADSGETRTAPALGDCVTGTGELPDVEPYLDENSQKGKKKKKIRTKKPFGLRQIVFISERVIFTAAGVILFICVYNDKLTHIPLYSIDSNISKEGYILSNLCILRVFRVAKPDSYSKSELGRIVGEIEEPRLAAGTVQPKNLIVIMNESFSDLEVINDLDTNDDYIPYLRSLDKNAVKGETYVNVFGGSTSVSEWEFLTGNTDKFLPIGANPYVGFCRSKEDGIVNTLKQQGYYAVAMHPYGAKNWNRNNVYPAMGFDEFIDESGYEGADRLRKFVSDKGDFDKIIDYVNHFDKDENLFIFNVTMQNHGGYDSSNGTMENTITINGMENDELAETYVSLIDKSDEAFEYLTGYFSKVDEPTMIVMFGDHQPQLSKEFTDELYGKDSKSLSAEEANRMYITQYVIWTNYDSDFEQFDEISVNYLSSYVLRCAGLKLTDYDKFLLNQRESVPVIGMKGVKMADGSFVSYQNLDKKILEDYKALEYLRVKDRKSPYYEIFELQDEE